MGMMVSAELDDGASLTEEQLKIANDAVLRHFRGNITALARHAKVDRTWASQILNGRTRPGANVAGKLARSLNIPVAVLVPGSDPGEWLSALQAPPSSKFTPDTWAAVEIGLRRGLVDALHQGGMGNIARSVAISLGLPDEGKDLERLDVYGPLAAARRLLGQGQLPEPMETKVPPKGYEDALGINGLGLVVRGDSMTGWHRPIRDGDIVWINQEDETQRTGVCVAVVREKEDSPPVAVVKWLEAPSGRLWSYPPSGRRELLDVAEVITTTPVVAVTHPEVTEVP